MIGSVSDLTMNVRTSWCGHPCICIIERDSHVCVGSWHRLGIFLFHYPFQGFVIRNQHDLLSMCICFDILIFEYNCHKGFPWIILSVWFDINYHFHRSYPLWYREFFNRLWFVFIGYILVRHNCHRGFPWIMLYVWFDFNYHCHRNYFLLFREFQSIIWVWYMMAGPYVFTPCTHTFPVSLIDTHCQTWSYERLVIQRVRVDMLSLICIAAPCLICRWAYEPSVWHAMRAG